MTRPKGKRWPSDHRRHIRIPEDYLDDPRLMSVDADVFRLWVRLLLMTNRAKSPDGELRLDRFALNAAAMRQQVRHSLAIARAGAEAGLYELREEGVCVVIRFRNWLEEQGKPPADPQLNPDETPPPVPVPVPLPVPVPIGGGGAPPLAATARGIGGAAAREADARRQVEIALERSDLAKGTARDECLIRLEILAAMFLASSRVADAAQLEGYLRATREVSTRFLQGAIDRAVRESETSFAPAAGAIVAAARKVESEARKRAREADQQSRIVAAGGDA